MAQATDGVRHIDTHLTEAALAEGDVMRHTGDKTVKVLTKAGKPIGEIGIDGDASPGGGQYYVKLYDGSLDESGFDTAKEAWEELTYAVEMDESWEAIQEDGMPGAGNKEALAKIPSNSKPDKSKLRNV
jgi:hypothetical protein